MVAKVIAKTLRTLISNARKVADELGEATQKRMKQREEHLSREMARLLEEMEQKTQEQSGGARRALPLAALQKWHFWVLAAVLVLLFWLCRLLGRRTSQRASSRKQGSCRKKADEEKQEEKPGVALDVGRISAKRTLDLPESFQMVEKLVDEILRMCHKLSRNSFMPRLQPAIMVGSAPQAGTPPEHDPVYCLLVPLKAPHGHTFHLELGTAEEMPARNSRLRVALECTCTRERRVEDMLCFLHRPKEELRKNQSSSLLGTLCTGPYLDLEKTTCWFKILVKAAWMLWPQSRHCQLIVLPSRHSCKLRLTDASGKPLLIEMIFGVKQRDSGTVLSIE